MKVNRTQRIWVSSNDGDLYRLAQKVYGDANAWFLIADANGMQDTDLTFLKYPIEVTIPPYVASGGIKGVAAGNVLGVRSPADQLPFGQSAKPGVVSSLENVMIPVFGGPFAIPPILVNGQIWWEDYKPKSDS